MLGRRDSHEQEWHCHGRDCQRQLPAGGGRQAQEEKHHPDKESRTFGATVGRDDRPEEVQRSLQRLRRKPEGFSPTLPRREVGHDGQPREEGQPDHGQTGHEAHGLPQGGMGCGRGSTPG